MNALDLPVHHRLDVADLDAGAVVLDPSATGWKVYVRIWLPKAISFLLPVSCDSSSFCFFSAISNSRAFRIRMAVSRLRSCERSFWQAHHDVGRQVRDAHRRVRGVDALPARPGGADRRPRADRPRGSSTSTSSTSGTADTEAKLVCRRLEASKGEMRMSRWTPISPREIPVGVLPGDLDRHRLDPRLFARQQVDHLGLEPLALTPAQVHAHQHLRPVLRLGAARARMDGEDRGLGVVRARQHDLELELFQLATQAGHAVGDLGIEAAVVAGFLGELQQDTEVGGLGGQLVDPAHGARQVGALANQLLGAAVVVPEGAAPPSRCRSRRVASPCRAGQRCLRSSSS